MNLSDFLEKKFVEWQNQMNRRMSLGEFAEYLGFKQSTLSMWMSGERQPDGESLRKLGLKLGLEIYDILEKKRPDEDLTYLQQNWENFTSAQRKAIREQAEAMYKPRKK